MMITQYRVETRQTDQHPNGESNWWPEGDHQVFYDIDDAQGWLDLRRDWYDNPARFEHRIASRQISEWEPVTT